MSSNNSNNNPVMTHDSMPLDLLKQIQQKSQEPKIQIVKNISETKTNSKNNPNTKDSK